MNWIGDVPLLNSTNIRLYGYSFDYTKSLVATSEWMSVLTTDADGLEKYIRSRSEYL